MNKKSSLRTRYNLLYLLLDNIAVNFVPLFELLFPFGVDHQVYLISILNNFNLPLKLGYLIAGSNHTGVFITGFKRVKVLNVYFP